jgi:hypothetical protein
MTYRSRWGYHPCDYATYLKLRLLHKAYFEGLKLLARWRRWRAKRPHNRKGPEPVVPDVLRWVCASPIVAEFQAARHGVAEPSLVKPLGISAEEIDRWVGLLR